MIDSGITTNSEATSAPRRSRGWLNGLLLVAIFGSGFVIGGLAAVRVVRWKVASVLTHPEQIPDRVMPILRMRLDLDDEQTEKVAAIIKQRHAALEDLRAEFSPRVAVELKQLRNEVDAVLKPEQRTHWDLWCRRIEAHLPNASGPSECDESLNGKQTGRSETGK